VQHDVIYEIYDLSRLYDLSMVTYSMASRSLSIEVRLLVLVIYCYVNRGKQFFRIYFGSSNPMPIQGMRHS